MLEIYFDGVLLHEDNYLSLTQKGTMFDKEFKLGTTLAREFELTIPKSKFNPSTSEVLIKYMSNDYAHLVIDEYSYNESSGIPTVDITLIDKMVLSNVNYDASGIVPTTALGVLQDICTKIGVELGSTEFTNSDVVVDYYDSTVQARTYIGYIAELAGGFARIENDGKLYIRTYSNANVSNTIVPELCEQIIIGEKHKVERVVFDNGLLVMKSSDDESLETLYLDSENVYINTETEFNNLCANIVGFEYYNLETGRTYILPSSTVGDVLKFTYDNVDYYTISQYEKLDFYGNWQGGYSLHIENSKQQETKVSGIDTQVKSLKVSLNRTENQLSIVVTDITTQKDVNSELLGKINANASKIEQTSGNITLSVQQITGDLDKKINDLDGDLDAINKDLLSKLEKAESQIEQLADRITSSVKSTGGNNLLRNSVGLGGLDFWDVTGNVVPTQDNYTEQNTISGSKFVMNGASSLTQYYITQLGTSYGIGFKLRHIVNGTPNAVYVRIHTTETDYHDVLVDAEQTNEYTMFTEFNTFTYTSKGNNPYLKIINDGDDTVEISDLIISTGDNHSWSGYMDEVYGKEHRLDKYGLELTDLASGNSTTVTNTTVEIVNSGEVVAELSKTQVKSDAGNFENKLQIRTLQIVALDDYNVVEYV